LAGSSDREPPSSRSCEFLALAFRQIFLKMSMSAFLMPT
jgi:hypothetical protein